MEQTEDIKNNTPEENTTAEPDAQSVRVTELENKVKEYEDMIRRQQAEFENYRKRSIRERTEYEKAAAQNVLLDLVGILDDFHRALVALEAHEEAKKAGWLEGIALIEKQITTVLQKNNVKMIEAVGEDFNPTFHEALYFEEKAGIETEKVGEVLQNGYTIGEKILRTAKVKVLKPSAN